MSDRGKQAVMRDEVSMDEIGEELSTILEMGDWLVRNLGNYKSCTLRSRDGVRGRLMAAQDRYIPDRIAGALLDWLARFASSLCNHAMKVRGAL